MRTYLLKRTFSMFTSLILIFIFSITLFVYLPGDYTNNFFMKREDKDELRRELGLDKTKPQQVLYWGKRLATFDLGNAFGSKVAVKDIIKDVVKNSASMYVLSFGVSIILGVILGALAAYKKGGVFDGVSRILVLIGISSPVVVVCTIFMAVYFYTFRVSVEYFYGTVNNRLTFVFLVLLNVPLFMKYSRSMMIDILSEDYIKTAKSKGLGTFKILFKHGMRNSLVGIVGAVGVSLNTIIFTGCLLETILQFNGIGSLVTQATFNRNYPLMLGSVVVLAFITVAFNYFFDIVMHIIDPRIRVAKEA